jgi:hypothetical protein
MAINKPFDQSHLDAIAAANAISSVLKKNDKRWFGIQGVCGYGVGGSYPHLTAVFGLNATLSHAVRAKARKRLPRHIKVGKKTVRCEIIEFGMFSFCQEPIGDGTLNRKDYHDNGKGEWEMGVRIQVFAKGGAEVATAGFVVVDRKSTNPNDPRYVLSCKHALLAAGNDVAQWHKDKNNPPPPMNNYVGIVGKLAPTAGIDGGLVNEVDGCKKSIIHIGMPKNYQKPTQGVYIRKSGGKTGLTYTTLGAAMDKFVATTPQGQLQWVGPLYVCRNACLQTPSNAAALAANLAPGEPQSPADIFADQADSGAPVVIGLPNDQQVFGCEDLDLIMQTGTTQDRQDTIAKYYDAAIGLVVGKGTNEYSVPDPKAGKMVNKTLDVVYIQDLKTITDDLGVKLDL